MTGYRISFSLVNPIMNSFCKRKKPEQFKQKKFGKMRPVDKHFIIIISEYDPKEDEIKGWQVNQRQRE